MSGPQLDIDAIEARADTYGVVAGSVALALCAEVRQLRAEKVELAQEVLALRRTRPARVTPTPQDGSFGSWLADQSRRAADAKFGPVTSTPEAATEPDDLDRLIAEKMKDPQFAAAREDVQAVHAVLDAVHFPLRATASNGAAAMNDELEWSRWPWNRCPAQTAQRERCDLRAEHKTPHVAERGLNADVVWSEHYFAVTLERLAEAVGGSDTPANQPDKGE